MNHVSLLHGRRSESRKGRLVLPSPTLQNSAKNKPKIRMSIAEAIPVPDHPLPKTEESFQEEPRFQTENQIFTFPSPLVSSQSSSASGGTSSLLSTTPALSTPIASYAVPCTPAAADSFASGLSALDRILPFTLKSEASQSATGGATTLAPAFSMSTNPFVNSLASPFLHHNIFLPHPLASPMFDNAVHLSNSWKLLDAYTRLSSNDTPSRGLPLPTPLFGDLLPSPFGGLASSISTPENAPSPAVPAASPPLDVEKHIEKNDLSSPPTSKSGQLQSLLQAARPLSLDPPSETCKPDPEASLEGREYKVRWGEHVQRLCGHVAACYGHVQTTDVSLVGSDGVAVSAHSLVMAAASPLLRRVLQDVKSDQPAVVVVPGASAAMLDAVVSVCYKGSVCLDRTLLPHVLKIAQALELTQLSFDDATPAPYGPTSTKPASSSPPSPKVKAPLPILPKPSFTSPSPPAVFTFTPPIPQHSPPPYSAALASSILAKTSAKRRPLTPDLAHTEQRAKKVKTGATFLPAEVHPSLSFSPVTPSKTGGTKHMSQSARSSPVPSSPFSSGALGGASCARDLRVVPDIVGGCPNSVKLTHSCHPASYT